MHAAPPPRFAVFATQGGFCGLAWSGAGIVRFQLPTGSAAATERLLRRRLADAEPADPPPAVAAAIAAVQRYFAGEPVDFADVAVDLGDAEPFFRRVYEATRVIGWGRTTTYGAIAAALGAGSEAARDVGRAMAQNPVALIIPCHRVLAAGGGIGGFSAPGGAEAKRRMLALEGMRFEPPPSTQQSFRF